MSLKTTHTLIKDVPTFKWRAPADYAPGVEVISMAHLYRRGSSFTDKRSTRFDFFMLAVVLAGRMDHAVDFLTMPCVVGSWMLVRPGQLQQFDYTVGLDGWVVMFRSDFLPSGEQKQQSPFHVLANQLNDFPSLIHLAPKDHASCCGIVDCLRADLQDDMGNPERNALLMYQLCTLLTRLKIFHRRGDKPIDPALKKDWERVSRLRKLIDEHFCVEHSVNRYAEKLGCTIKTLGRATHDVTGRTVKTMITERIILEAKRQLVHTRLPIQTIAHDLGFDEFSNFVKFFKKEAGCTPKAFRAHWLPPVDN